MEENSPLLLEALRELRGSVDGLRAGQDKMKDELHAAVLDNSERIGHMETKLALHDAGMKTLKAEVKADARRWGAAGGAGTSLVAVIGLLVKAAFGKS